jgi:hypothetical protein
MRNAEVTQPLLNLLARQLGPDSLHLEVALVLHGLTFMHLNELLHLDFLFVKLHTFAPEMIVHLSIFVNILQHVQLWSNEYTANDLSLDVVVELA